MGVEGITTPEAAAPAPVQAPPKAEPIAPAFGVLARKEKALQRQRQEFDSERARVEADKAAIAQERASYNAWQQQQQDLRRDPAKLLQTYGLTYQQLTDFFVNNGQQTPELAVSQIQADMAALRAENEQRERARQQEIEEQRKAQETQQAAQVEAAKSQLKTNINGYVDRFPNEYELIRTNSAQESIFAVMETHYQQTAAAGKPELLTIKQAADMVEGYIADQLKAIAKTKKGSEVFQPQAAPRPTQDPAPTRTLSNSNTTSAAPSLIPVRVENDRMARAMAALEGRK